MDHMEPRHLFVCHLEALPEEYPEFCLDTGNICCGIYRKKFIQPIIVWALFLMLLVFSIMYFTFVYETELINNYQDPENEPSSNNEATSSKNVSTTKNGRNRKQDKQKVKGKEDRQNVKLDERGKVVENETKKKNTLKNEPDIWSPDTFEKSTGNNNQMSISEEENDDKEPSKPNSKKLDKEIFDKNKVDKANESTVQDTKKEANSPKEMNFSVYNENLNSNIDTLDPYDSDDSQDFPIKRIRFDKGPKLEDDNPILEKQSDIEEPSKHSDLVNKKEFNKNNERSSNTANISHDGSYDSYNKRTKCEDNQSKSHKPSSGNKPLERTEKEIIDKKEDKEHLTKKEVNTTKEMDASVTHGSSNNNNGSKLVTDNLAPDNLNTHDSDASLDFPIKRIRVDKWPKLEDSNPKLERLSDNEKFSKHSGPVNKKEIGKNKGSGNKDHFKREKYITPNKKNTATVSHDSADDSSNKGTERENESLKVYQITSILKKQGSKEKRPEKEIIDKKEVEKSNKNDQERYNKKEDNKSNTATVSHESVNDNGRRKVIDNPTFDTLDTHDSDDSLDFPIKRIRFEKGPKLDDGNPTSKQSDREELPKHSDPENNNEDDNENGPNDKKHITNTEYLGTKEIITAINHTNNKNNDTEGPSTEPLIDAKTQTDEVSEITGSNVMTNNFKRDPSSESKAVNRKELLKNKLPVGKDEKKHKESDKQKSKGSKKLSLNPFTKNEQKKL